MINYNYIERNTYYTIEYFVLNSSWEPLTYKGSIYDGIKQIDIFNFECTRPKSTEPCRFKSPIKAFEFILDYRIEHNKRFRIIEHFKDKSKILVEGTVDKETRMLGVAVMSDSTDIDDPYLAGLKDE